MKVITTEEEEGIWIPRGRKGKVIFYFLPTVVTKVTIFNFFVKLYPLAMVASGAVTSRHTKMRFTEQSTVDVPGWWTGWRGGPCPLHSGLPSSRTSLVLRPAMGKEIREDGKGTLVSPEPQPENGTQIAEGRAGTGAPWQHRAAWAPGLGCVPGQGHPPLLEPAVSTTLSSRFIYSPTWTGNFTIKEVKCCICPSSRESAPRNKLKLSFYILISLGGQGMKLIVSIKMLCIMSLPYVYYECLHL